MKIVYDGKKAVKNLTGIGNYSRRCINAVSQLQPRHEVSLLAPAKQNSRAAEQIAHDRATVVTPSGLWKACYELWRNLWSWHVAKRLHADIYHGLSNELPFGITKAGCKNIVTIHDLIFLRFPKTYPWLQQKILHVKTRYACKHADRIVAISECTKRDIVELYHIPEEKIEVVYQSINPVFYVPIAKTETDAALQKYGIDGNYVLSVGTIERRKNQEQLVCAADRLPQGVKVVILGKRTPYQDCLEQMVREKHLENRVRILNGVDNHDLCCFYQRASVAVYTSLYEGFGLPVVEALASGCPVIAAKGSCLEEAGGEHTLYIDPQNAEELADAITQIVSDKELQHTMRQQGLAYAQRFRDEAMAAELNRIYQEVTA